jgi:hypothetical protein
MITAVRTSTVYTPSWRTWERKYLFFTKVRENWSEFEIMQLMSFVKTGQI